jgi:hypothetical protein
MQDSTFECVASDLTFETQPGPMAQAAARTGVTAARR